MYTNYEHLLEMTLRENQLTLFDLNGKERQLDYQRHVADYVKRLDGLPKGQKIAVVLQLTLDVWASWEIHIKKSSYSLPHYGGIHIEDSWLKSGRGTPPCIILSNRPLLVQEKETLEELPQQINWKCDQVLGPITIRLLAYTSRGRRYRAWRIYLSDSV